jgi:hypothetical protein
MVVDGRVEFVGSDAGRARSAIAAAARGPKASVAVEVAQPSGAARRLRIRVERLPHPADAEVLLAVTERNLQTNVLRGENQDRLLKHTAVVRRLITLGETRPDGFTTEANITLDPAWNHANLRAVVVVHQRGPGQVLGAASVPL